MTNVLIVEDQRLSQEMLIQYLKEASGRYTLVSCILSADDALAICESQTVDLILMDVCTAENASGLKAAAQIKKRFPGIKIIIVTSMPEFRFLTVAREAGVESFWYKDTLSDDLLLVMDRTVAGESIYPDTTPSVRVGKANSETFTPRERDVLYWIVQGKTLSQIAKELHISETTVRYHLDNLKEHTGCKNKLELAIMAVETGLVLPHYT